MFKRSSLWRGLTLVFSLLLAISLMAGSILETYRTSVDAFFNTRSQLTETEVDETGEAWSYVSKFKTAKEAFEGLKEFAIRESQETVALLKNDGNALPLSKDAKITMLGVRSYPCTAPPAARLPTATRPCRFSTASPSAASS